MPDAQPHDDPAHRPSAGADTQGTPQTAPGRPGSLPFTPYGGTTAPYRPKADSAPKPRPPKTFHCNPCKTSFATRSELDAHNRSAHPASGGASAEVASVPGKTPPGDAAGPAP